MPQLSCFVASVWSLIFLVLLSTVSGQASGPSSPQSHAPRPLSAAIQIVRTTALLLVPVLTLRGARSRQPEVLCDGVERDPRQRHGDAVNDHPRCEMESRCTTEQQRRLFDKQVIVPQELLLQRGTVNQLARFGDTVRKACTQGCYVAGLLLTDMQKANRSCDWRSLVALKSVPNCTSTHIVPYSCVKAASMRVEARASTIGKDQARGLASLFKVKPQPWYSSDRSFDPYREAFVGVHLNIDVDWIASICHKAPPNWLWDAQGSISMGLFEAGGTYAGFVRASVITPFVRQMQQLFNGSLSGKPVVVATSLGKQHNETAWILREFEAEVALVLGVRVISGSSGLAERELNAMADLHVLGHSKAFLGWSGSTFSRFVEQMLPADIPVAKFVARSDHCARHVRQSFGDDRFEQLHRSFHAAAKRTATVFRRGVSKRAVGSAACFQVGAPSSGLALPTPSPS